VKVPKAFGAYDADWWSKRFPTLPIEFIVLQNFEKDAPISKQLLKNRFSFLKVPLKYNRIDLITKFLDFLSDIRLGELDRIIKEAINANNAEAVAVLIEYKTKIFPPHVIEKIASEKLHRALGISEYTLNDLKNEYEFNLTNKHFTITQYLGFDEFIIIPEMVENRTPYEIGENAFEGCDFICYVRIPSTVKTINNKAFKGCTSLSDITIPEGVKTIGEYAFEDCVLLKSIIIPKSVTKIHPSSFSQCKNLIIKCFSGSIAHHFAKKYSIPFEIIE
jgi:hypothetical protein